MPVSWLHPNPDGYSWAVLTYVEEVAPSMRVGAPKHERQTWFIVNLQPDGICMNCRQRPGLQDPIGGYYACAECRAQAEQAIGQVVALRAACP
jgi:hypothetical protein